MGNEIAVNDIADNLLILNKTTIDTLFRLDNCSDCIALYIFYYKTAKWQKTNTIKANDEYIKKSLKWGSKKILTTKQALKEAGLIDIIQKRKGGRIEGWYMKINYLVQQRKIEDIKITVENTNSSNNSQKQQVDEATNGFQETNALKEYIKCLKKEIEMLKENTKEKKSLEKEEKKETYGKYGRVKLKISEYLRLREEFGEEFIQNQIELLDEYLEMNNNKNKYTNFNLVLRKSIRENWFKDKKQEQKGNNVFLDIMKEDYESIRKDN